MKDTSTAKQIQQQQGSISSCSPSTPTLFTYLLPRSKPISKNMQKVPKLHEQDMSEGLQLLTKQKNSSAFET